MQHLFEIPHCLTQIAEVLHCGFTRMQLGSFFSSSSCFWESAFMPHPFRRNEVIHTFWKGERQPGVWGLASSHPRDGSCFAASRVRPLALVMQRRPLQQRRQRRALGEAAEVGVFFRRGRLLPCLCLQHSARAHTVDLEQLSTSVASGQQNSDDTASQLATRDPCASSLGHRRYPHQVPRRRLPCAAARGRRLLVPSRGRRRLGSRLAFSAVLVG